MSLNLSDARPEDAPAIAALWHHGWHDAHGEIVPADLTEQRTLPSFETRSAAHIPNTQVARLNSEVVGFVMIHDDELFQMYVAPAGRGTGVAGALMQAAETRMAQSGLTRVFLACAIGNDRAKRFYEKQGWENMGEHDEKLETLGAPYVLRVWRFEKSLQRPT